MPLERLDHVLVLTDDIEATKAFYCDALGFEVGNRPPFAFSGYWLYLDGAPCLHVADRAEYEAEAARLRLAVGSAVDHVAFGGSDYDALVERLEAAGVDAVSNEVPGVLRQLYLTDPNGVRIELNVPVPGT
ncbi:MAG TPA: VOC family protein [Gaiellaceae bacterium]|jgi:catechol 2,3-dioxygenase-like lactoylglutathione lyase family enzyme